MLQSQHCNPENLPVLEQDFAIQQTCQTKTTELDSRVASLEKELSELKQRLAKPAEDKQGRQEEAKQAEKSLASQSNAEPIARVGDVRKAEQQPDEEIAEKWLRENLDK